MAGNSRVFSWRIDDNKYGYLYVPQTDGGNTSLISERIVDDGILGAMAQEVASWDIDTYTSKFNALNNAIISKYGSGIPGSASDYFGKDTGNYIVLTGKDGATKEEKPALDEETVDAIKKLVSSTLQTAKEELKTEVVSIKEYTLGKFTENVETVKQAVDSIKTEVAASNEELKLRLEEAENSMSVAAELFDLNGNGITKENLSNAIRDANETKIRVGSNEIAVDEQRQRLDNANTKISGLESASETLNTNLQNLSNTTSQRFANVESSISEMNSNIENMKVSMLDFQQADTAEQQTLSKSRSSSFVEESVFIDTIDNNDGSYDLVTNAGEEKYTIKIYGYGKKLNSKNVEDGLVLTSNGFRYKDSSGSIISMLGGNILLSNSDGSGKLEIKKDGIYINGKKQ